MKLWKGLLCSSLAALMLAGCGDADSDKENSSEEAKQQEVAEESGYPKKFTDGRGVEVVIDEKPTRIVSTTLAVDEYLMDLTDVENILAVTQISTDAGISNVAGETDDIPNKLEKVTSEQVLALNPDLVIVPSYVDANVLNQLDEAGVTTYQVVDDSSFAGILETVEVIGEIIGEEEKAAAVIKDFKERVAALEENAAEMEAKKRVLYYTEYSSSVTDNTTIGEMIKLAGGINVVTEAGISGDAYPDYPSISKEVLVELNPEVIITTGWGAGGEEPAFVTEWKNDPALANVDAIKNNKVYVLDSANVTTASHFVIEGAEDIQSVLAEQ